MTLTRTHRHWPTAAVFTLILILASACAQTAPAPPPTASPPAIGVAAAMLPATNTATPVAPTQATTGTTPPGATLMAITTATATATATPTAVPPTPPALPMATAPLPQTVSDVPGAQVPPGFSFKLFADLYRPTSLTINAAGRLYTTSFDGTVHVLSDNDGDGRADSDTIFARGFDTPLGITIRPGTSDVYVSSKGRITILSDSSDDQIADNRRDLVTGLPSGLHHNDNLKFGPDGLLYMGVGSTCDACAEDDPRSATIMRFDPDTGAGEVIATGLRNPYDLAFHPVTNTLFATDNGRDDLGMDAPREELNHIIEGSDYGWPSCWDNGQGSGCDGTETAVAFFESHSSANSLVFYDGDQFPGVYWGDAYVTIFGSFLKEGVQTGIRRVELEQSGNGYTAVANTWFATWPDGMPLGLTIGPDGALYVGDYINSKIYRISYGP